MHPLTLQTVLTLARWADESAAPITRADTTHRMALAIFLFAALGAVFALGILTVGKLLRPTRYHPEKASPYECGEPAIGDSWVQFDLRFYTVALVFIVFDVEVALLWAWAVAFKEMGAAAFWPFLVFFLLIAVPFLYEWKSGYLNWVRSSAGQRRASLLEEEPPRMTGTEWDSSAPDHGEPALTDAVSTT